MDEAEKPALRTTPGITASTEFRQIVYENAALNTRDLPWRKNRDPWAILVSEVMLQQTQVGRVVPKFETWMRAFPTALALAMASVSDVLGLWSGLGYNRRALALRETAIVIARDFGGEIPRDESSLRSLPGIGLYTARAILAFAFDIPTVFLETNIRTVYMKHFFADRDGVTDRELAEIGSQVLDADAPARWYNALMDYGASLKRTEGNHSRRTKSWHVQEPFATSSRRVRGAILRTLLEQASIGPVAIESLPKKLSFPEDTVVKCVRDLAAEGFVKYESGGIRIV
jgi:A/G-specific adenine glycosylase